MHIYQSVSQYIISSLSLKCIHICRGVELHIIFLYIFLNVDNVAIVVLLCAILSSAWNFPKLSHHLFARS